MEALFGLGIVLIFVLLVGIGMWKALTGCTHKWVINERGSKYYPGTNIKIGVYVIMECEHCHKLKTRES